MTSSKRSISSSDPSFWPYFQLFEGDLESLAEHLRSDDPIHPLLRDALAELLSRTKGSPRLDFVRMKQGRPRRTIADKKKDAEIAEFVEAQPELAKQTWIKAATKFGVSEKFASRAVERRNADRRRFKRFLSAHGLANEDLEKRK